MLRIFLIFALWTNTSFAEDLKLGWSNESGLGYVVTGGNAQSETTSFRQTTKYQWQWDLLAFTGHYIQSSGLANTPTVANPTQQTNQTTAENWAVTARYEKTITPKWFNTFVAYGWNGDRFQGVREAQFADLGAKYFTANQKDYTQFFELGYRYSRQLLTAEPLTPEDKVGVGSSIFPEYHLVRIYAQVDYAHSKTFAIGAWIEYLPSITDFETDQFINYSPYLTSVLTDMFSLKVAYEGRYRSTPAVRGNELTDYTFTTSLIAKF